MNYSNISTKENLDRKLTVEEFNEQNKVKESNLNFPVSLVLQNTKRRPTKIVYSLLEKFNSTNDFRYIQRTTFRYIYNFKVNGVVEPRLNVALSDFGFYITEIQQMDLKEIIQELLNRE